ncbi:MAG: DUF1232 domain-containing protein [Myxococcales bacterium]|nr:DUF1232 domain-containing protein [Myxococcales bacterium]
MAETKHHDFYQDLRHRIRAWLEGKGVGYKYADLLLVGPDLFHLLCRLVVDPAVPLTEKAKLAATIAYFVSPLDLVPEGLAGPVGYVDDVALTAYVLNGLLKSTSAEVLRRHWAGEGDVLGVIQRVLDVADGALASGLWSRLKSLADRGLRPH